MTQDVHDMITIRRDMANPEFARMLLTGYKNLHIFRSLFLLLLMMVVGINGVWGQTNYSGTYFLSGNNQGQDSYNIANTTTNFYLCPTEDWIFYQATDNFTTTDNGQPFLTTYQYRNGTNDYTKAVWIIEKHQTQNYYYIKYAKDGRYLTFNGKIGNSTSANRIRYHLEETDSPDDKMLFTINYSTSWFIISPKNDSGWYLNINQGNQPSLQGTYIKDKNDGPEYTLNGETTRYVGGTIGRWNKSTDYTSKWYIELFTPEISVENCTFTLSYPIEDNTVEIRYTTDGTTPTASSTLYTAPFTPGLDAVQIKVAAFKKNISTIQSPIVSSDNFPKLSAPTCELNEAAGKLILNTSVEDGIIYYKTGGDAPTISDENKYTAPFSVTEGTVVKAFVAKQCNAPSDIITHEVVKVATPTFELLEDNTVKISSETPDVIIYYNIGDNLETLEDPNTSSNLYTSPLTVETGKYFKAIAVKAGCLNSSVATTTEAIKLKCAKPTIKRMGRKLKISSSFPSSGYTIRYTIADNGGTPADPNSSSMTYTEPVDVSTMTPPITIKAYVSAPDYTDSDNSSFTLSSFGNGTEADPYIISTQEEFNSFVSNVNTNANGEAGKYYQLMVDVDGGSAITTPFTGGLEGVADEEDGSLPTISGLTHALFNTVNGGKVKNIILDNVNISSGTNVGAICNEATGDSRIYNCGVLATNSTVETDDDGYTSIASYGSTIKGSGYVGGIVGLLDGSARVINCYSYAKINGGDYVGGIVGYNNVATTATNLQTMVMNCMFYGDIDYSFCNSVAPIYNGEIISNAGESGLGNYNYFWSDASYVKHINFYHCALAAETRFLQRFEFFRHLLNSNRELAAWWATDDAANKDEMMKWVLEPSQIGTSTPYPILKNTGYYASVVNYTPSTTAYDEDHRNQGRKLTNEGDGGVLHVTIQMGDGARFNRPFKGTANAAVISNGSVDLTISDKDFEHFNFNYGKVQLPYYNDYGTQNYRDGRVVTGWKIVSISGGTASGYTTGADVTFANGELTATPYNFADRKCTDKDLYSASGRIFNQGAYWDVPEGVTAITIEPYWGKAVYLADEYLDVVYNTEMTTAYPVSAVGGGQRYSNGVSTFNEQLIYTSMANAVSALSPNTSYTVYDYAVVLVGNYHQYNSINDSKPYTVMSIDKDNDNEPDYSFRLRFDGRTKFHPVKYDFLDLIGLGMAQKSTGGTGSYNFGIMQPQNWFEVTNTALFRVTQFEYSQGNRTKKPYILQGGVIEQWVTSQQNAGDRVEYFHVGGNVWFKEFHRGSHQDNTGMSTPHPPLSVTGGDYDKFYLTGAYQSQAENYDDNAECYINGGRFGEVAGAGMEGIGGTTNHTNGNVTWVIDNADIDEFYGGGINGSNPIQGNIYTKISNSHVTLFCGGPKFGDMIEKIGETPARTVRTDATNCTFGTYFGAGYGGNSYGRYAPKNFDKIDNISWADWVSGTTVPGNDNDGTRFGGYKQDYSNHEAHTGVSVALDYQFLPNSVNALNVARLFVDYVSFSLATTRDVTSNLTGCTILGNFYGGGSLGKVEGPVTSILDGCKVKGNAFGAGFSASLPTVEVMPTSGFITEPKYDPETGNFSEGVLPSTETNPPTVTYTWEHADEVNSTATAIKTTQTEHILYTEVNLSKSNLGSVSGNVSLSITGNSKIGTEGDNATGNVYGGGDASYVTPSIVNDQPVANTGNTTVTLAGNTEVLGDVFGGGNNGEVSGTATVKILETLPTE